MRKISSYKSGYTLVETLMVLAIVGLLAALIFAAFGPARQKGRETGCMSNFHQWGKAFAMYIADNDGIEPNVGSRLTHAQLGLPNENQAVEFAKTYKLYPGAASHCPNDHEYVKPGTNPHGTSYMGMAFFSELTQPPEEILEVTSRMGQRYGLLACLQHNANLDFSSQPTWATKKVQVLRINQEVKTVTVPASDDSSDSW